MNWTKLGLLVSKYLSDIEKDIRKSKKQIFNSPGYGCNSVPSEMFKGWAHENPIPMKLLYFALAEVDNAYKDMLHKQLKDRDNQDAWLK